MSQLLDRVLNLLNAHTSLGKNLFLNLLVYSDALGMLTDVVNFQFCHGNT